MVPLIMLVSTAIGFFAGESAAREEQHVAVIDETADLYPLLEEILEFTPIQLTLYPLEAQNALEEKVKEGDYNGYLHLTDDSVQQGTISYYVGNTREHAPYALSSAVSTAVTFYRLDKMGLDPEEINLATAPVRLQSRALTGEEATMAAFLVPMAVGMILIFAAIFSGQVLMYGVIKEKRNRIVEILLSSVSALDLLLGKVLGFAALGLIQVGIWLAVGLAVAGRFFDLSQVNLTPADLIPSVIFFLGGYLLFAALFAALGATMKDAEGGSQSQGLVILIPIIPMFASGVIMMAPNALWVRILSITPPFIPVTMLLRIAATTLPWWELAAIFVILMISVVIIIILGARIFNRGLLQFDRTISFKEIRRMLRKNYS